MLAHDLPQSRRGATIVAVPPQVNRWREIFSSPPAHNLPPLSWTVHDSPGADVCFGMKKRKFTRTQIAFILRHAEEWTFVGEGCGEAGVWDASLV